MAFSFKKLFTLPKSKDIWTAATKGSTGGWAAPFAKPATLLPAAAALAAIPFSGGVSAGFLPAVLGGAGLGIGALQGATTGLWGKPGVSSALKGGLLGGLQGAGVGALGGSMAGTTASNAAADAAMYQGGAGGGSAMGSYVPYKAAAMGGGIGAGMGAGLGAGVGSSIIPTATTTAANTALTGAETAAGTSTLSKLFSGINPYQTGAGLALSSIPSAFSQTPQYELSPMFGEATSRLLGGKGISELGALGREKLMGNLNQGFESTPDAYYKAATSRLNEAYDKAEQDFARQYKGLRPGANVENDSAYREGINKIRQDRARETSNIAADLDYRRENEYLTRQAQSIRQALGVDEQTMQDYMALAQLETGILATNTGVSIAEAQQFKDIFGQLGSAFMQRGLGLDAETSLERLKKQFLNQPYYQYQ